MFVRSYDHSETESSLSVKHWPHSPAAVCSLQPSFSSLLHPLCLSPPLSPHVLAAGSTSGVVLSFAGEGRKWEQTGTWHTGCGQEGEWKEEVLLFFDVHSALMFLIKLFEVKENLKLRWLFWGPLTPPSPSEVWRCLPICFNCTFTFCRNLSKKYNPKRSSKDEPECRWATVVLRVKPS